MESRGEAALALLGRTVRLGTNQGKQGETGSCRRKPQPWSGSRRAIGAGGALPGRRCGGGPGRRNPPWAIDSVQARGPGPARRSARRISSPQLLRHLPIRAARGVVGQQVGKHPQRSPRLEVGLWNVAGPSGPTPGLKPQTPTMLQVFLYATHAAHGFRHTLAHGPEICRRRRNRTRRPPSSKLKPWHFNRLRS